METHKALVFEKSRVSVCVCVFVEVISNKRGLQNFPLYSRMHVDDDTLPTIYCFAMAKIKKLPAS